MRLVMRPLAFALAVALVSLGGVCDTARSEGIGLYEAGPLIGFSSSPDQFVFGGIADFGELAQNLHLVGSADIGFGDNFTVISAGPSVLYEIPLDASAGSLFFGGGIALVYSNFSVDTRLGNRDYSDTELGVAGDVGYKLPLNDNNLIFDIKIGIVDYNDAKFLVGYQFNVGR